MSNNSLKPLKMFQIGAFIAVLFSLSSASFAEEQGRKFDLFSKTYKASMSDNVYYWSSDFTNKLQSQIPITVEKTKKNSFGERIAAVGLSILVEFATHESFNDLEVK